MPKIKYQDLAIGEKRLQVIKQANVIIAEYTAQGFNLTLRQLYYQFVARDLIPNKQSEYNKLSSIIADGRLAGLIDWDAIVDRTRNLAALAHWQDPPDIVDAIAQQFRVDKWATQPARVEVWIEKDALIGVIEGVCQELDVPYFSCRGFTSISEVWAAAMRYRRYVKAGQEVVVLHFGDHDPSGIEMTRDIGERFRMFGARVDVRRLALNFDQVEQYDPPPNPAKATDPRFRGYQEQHGDESWELDALDPATLAALIRDEIGTLIDRGPWEEEEAKQIRGRAELAAIRDRYDDVREFLDLDEASE